eukprot:scaffold34958_cov63-Phaeocystis_antarctica.AAC.1
MLLLAPMPGSSQASTLAATLKLAAGRRLTGTVASRAALSSRMASLIDMVLTRLISALSVSTRSTERARFTPMACRRSSGGTRPTPLSRASSRSWSYRCTGTTSLRLSAPSPIGARPSLGSLESSSESSWCSTVTLLKLTPRRLFAGSGTDAHSGDEALSCASSE